MSNANKGAGILAAVLITLVVAAPTGYMLGSRAGQKTAAMDTATVGEVNGAKITKTDLYNRMVTESGAKVMDDIIREKLVNQEAEKQKVSVTPAEIDSEISKIKERLGGEAAFTQALEQNNITMAQLREYQDFRLKATKILKKDITFQDADVKAFFEENKAQFDKREVTARHILVATEEEAKAVKAELDKGADFAKLAKEKSTEPAAKESGGDLGTFGPGKMVPDFDKVVFAMKKGEISQPFKTDFGWHVAQVTDLKGSAPSFDAMKTEVTEMFIDSKVQEKLQPWLTDLQDKAKITNTLAPKK
ncbi:MAG TPA: peptidylprolyl isomerase [Symbiobacteriaceae bacterium]|nr:peptidylprolyl isomerase [Symbiobacteriaceae bacterium]